ncbi:MAG: hypothetical protein JWN11_990 [Hyphomicrobiales bacterium]|nr:hypothetical protein [Hyphomicrobiales bacterium]
MNLLKVLAVAGVTLTLAVAGTNAQQATGMKELGVDISNAGTTKEQNQQFMQNLSAADQAKVSKECFLQPTEPVQSRPAAIVAFCRNVTPPAQ